MIQVKGDLNLFAEECGEGKNEETLDSVYLSLHSSTSYPALIKK